MQSTRIPARSLLCLARPSQRDWSLPPWPLLLARAPRPETGRNEGAPILPPKGERTRTPTPTPQPLLFSGILALGNPDRKSTRLNSSHRCISYAVFCLKKKNKLNEKIENIRIIKDDNRS